MLAQRPAERFVEIAHDDLYRSLPVGRLVGRPLVELWGVASLEQIEHSWSGDVDHGGHEPRRRLRLGLQEPGLIDDQDSGTVAEVLGWIAGIGGELRLIHFSQATRPY